MCPAILRVDCKGLPEAGFRIVHTALIEQDAGKVVVRLGQLRLQGDRIAQDGFGIDQIAVSMP